MNRKQTIRKLALFLLTILLGSLAVNIATASTASNGNPTSVSKAFSPVYVGVTFCGNTTAQAKLLIDRVKSYTNLFVIQSGPVSKNEIVMTQISQYAINAGLNLIVYIGWLDPSQPWQLPWLIWAKQHWGNQFLGVYFDDEPSGVPLDFNWTGYFTTQKLEDSPAYQEHAFAIDGILNGTYPQNYVQAATISENAIARNLAPLKNSSLTVFTSDYVLQWFDYLGGYNVVFAELGWNESIAQNIDLIRGAAQAQNKLWGAIVTWKYTQAPYLDTGENIYRQMLMAYEAGAKYIVIFNYPQIPGDPYGTMQDQHFEALQKLWNTITETPKACLSSFSQAQAVLVLPRDYGFGLRSATDRIWGYWGPDNESAQVYNITQALVSEYGLRLNIVYDDPAFPVAGKYPLIYYWNQTITHGLGNALSTSVSQGCPIMPANQLLPTSWR